METLSRCSLSFENCSVYRYSSNFLDILLTLNRQHRLLSMAIILTRSIFSLSTAYTATGVTLQNEHNNNKIQ
jgi:hypothetical protein